MQYSKTIYPILAMAAILMATSCSNDADEVEIREDGKVHVNVGVEMENTVEVTTRATAGYEDFTGEIYNGWVMGVLANTNGVTDMGTATYSWSGSEGTWASDLWLGPSAYSFYAYIPYDKDASVGLEDASSQPKLVFKGRSPFVTKDLLVSVGANNKDQSVSTGSYTATVSQTGTNQVNFRMNHILAKLVLKFQLPTDNQYYDNLRKIEITSVTLGSDVDNSRSYDITCDYSSTMTCSYAPAAANANEKASLTLAYDGKGTSILGGKALTLSSTTPGPLLYDFDGSNGEFFVIPDVVNKNDKHLKLTITYNIFTKDSTTGDYVETRHQVTATNSSLVVCRDNGTEKNIEAAKSYVLTVKVVPRYLYMLADIDQSNSIVLN